MTSPREVVRLGNIAAILVYGADAAGLLAMRLNWQERFGLIWLVLLSASVVGLFVSAVRARKSEVPTTVGEFLRMSTRSFTNLVLAIALGLSTSLLDVPMFNERNPWYSVVVFVSMAALIAAHQFYRGARRMRQRWRSAEDIRRSMKGITHDPRMIPMKYDYAFGVMVIAALGLVRAGIGVGLYEFVIAVALLLTIPYISGARFAQHRLLQQFLPADEPLP